jgi:SPP1 gp7 family putative phage head morphogenesis protein
MLAAECALLERMLRLAQEAIARLLQATFVTADPARARRMAMLASGAVGDELRTAIAAAIVAGRAQARRAAASRLAAELSQVARELRTTMEPPPANDNGAEDQAAAQGAAEGYVSAWRAGMVAAIIRWDGERSLAQALRKATDQQRHRLERIAATEVSRAYAAEHDEGIGWVAERHKDARWLPLVAKRWDATLDRKACPICRDMDGRLALPGMRWKGGLIPGTVHPHCRCMPSLIVLPLRLRGEIEPGRQVDAEHPREAA